MANKKCKPRRIYQIECRLVYKNNTSSKWWIYPRKYRSKKQRDQHISDMNRVWSNNRLYSHRYEYRAKP